MMKLSEALRLGEFAARKTHGKWFDRDSSGNICGACAVGRICMAVGFVPTAIQGASEHEQFDKECVEISKEFAKRWPWTVSHAVNAPSTKVIDNPVACRISDMYEYKNSSIQQIADWVATIEPQDAQPTQEVTHEVLDQPAHTHHD